MRSLKLLILGLCTLSTHAEELSFGTIDRSSPASVSATLSDAASPRATGAAPVTELSAYVYEDLVKIQGTKVLVTQNYTNIRKGPGTSYNIANVAKKGDEYSYLGKVGNWVHLGIAGTYSPAQRDYTKIGVVKVASVLNLRVSPWGRVIGQLRNGSRVELLAKEGDWYKVNYAGKTGYCHKSYIDPEDGEEGYDWFEKEVQPSDKDPESQAQTASPEVKRTPGGGVEVAGVPVYAQNGRDPFDSRGGKGQYPRAYCGPTSLQMVLAYHGVKKSRDYLALTNVGAGPMYRKGQGSAYDPMVRMAKSLGFSKTEIQWNASIRSLKNNISQGRPQIVSVAGRVQYKGGGSYNTQGHIMVITGVTDDGDVITNDSATGRRAVLAARDFTRIWRGFSVDIKK